MFSSVAGERFTQETYHNLHFMIRPSIIFIVAGIHFLLSFVAFGASFGITLDSLRDGDSLTLVEWCIKRTSDLLFFPLGTLLFSIAPKNIPPTLQYILFALNSLLWGACIYAVLRGINRRNT